MKIDIFPHILPIKYKEALYRAAPDFYERATIEQMDIPDAEKKKIFADNAIKLLRLTI